MTPQPAASGLRSATPMARDAILLDTGFLVSLMDNREPLHAAAMSWLSRQRQPLWSVPAVMVDTAHFIPAWLRPQLARAASSGLVRVSAPDAAGCGRIAWLLEKYAGLSPD